LSAQIYADATKSQTTLVTLVTVGGELSAQHNESDADTNQAPAIAMIAGA